MRASPRPGMQRGTALIVALIILVVLTLLGLAGLRTVTLQERMTANAFDRALAFQASEAALRDGEQQARAHVFDNVAFDNAASAWQDLDVAALIDAAADPGAPLPPDKLKYHVERLKSQTDSGLFPCDAGELPGGDYNCVRYLVTARSRGDSRPRARVELQTVYVVRQ